MELIEILRQSPAAFAAAALVVGLLVGSFLNVVIHRLPKMMDAALASDCALLANPQAEPPQAPTYNLVTPRSACPACRAPIGALQNVPVVSWLVLRGRCAYCDEQISARYPLVEATTAVLFAALTARIGLTLALPAYLYLAAISITLVMIAADEMRLPDSLVLPSYALAVLMLMPAGAGVGEWAPAERALTGLVALSALYFALTLAYPGILSLADVKLAGLLGLYLGWMSWAALAVGAVAGLLIGALSGAIRRLVHQYGREASLAIGRHMIIATGLALFLVVPVTHLCASVVALA